MRAEARAWVATELVTNALKYGAGDIRVTFRDSAQDGPVLVVEDDGQGLSSAFDPKASRGLGMRIVTGLLCERGAGLHLDSGARHTRLVARLPRASVSVAA